MNEISPLVKSGASSSRAFNDDFDDTLVQIKVEDTADDEDGESVLNKAFDENEKRSAIFTPKAKKNLLGTIQPRTPTPFKNALDEFRKIRGGETYVPSSPNGLVEDITEIMNKEKEQDNTVDSVYETDCSTTNQTQHEQSGTMGTNPKRLSFDDVDNNGQNAKKAKKSLDAAWSSATTATIESKDLPYIVETPVRLTFISFLICTQ